MKDRWGIDHNLEAELSYIMHDNACGRRAALIIYNQEVRSAREIVAPPARSYRFLGKR